MLRLLVHSCLNWAFLSSSYRIYFYKEILKKIKKEEFTKLYNLVALRDVCDTGKQFVPFSPRKDSFRWSKPFVYNVTSISITSFQRNKCQTPLLLAVIGGTWRLKVLHLCQIITYYTDYLTHGIAPMSVLLAFES